jgi:hypothetical protein
MKRLSTEQEKTKRRLLAAALHQRDKLEQQVEAYNAAVAAAWEKLAAAIEDVNAALAELNDFIGGVTGDMEAYADGRSERWQESDAGQNYLAWKDQWLAATLDDVDLDQPEDIDMPEVPIEQVEELPDAPDEP